MKVFLPICIWGQRYILWVLCELSMCFRFQTCCSSVLPHENTHAKVTHFAERLTFPGYHGTTLTFSLCTDSASNSWLTLAMPLQKVKTKHLPNCLFPAVCIIERNMIYSFNMLRNLRPWFNKACKSHWLKGRLKLTTCFIALLNWGHRYSDNAYPTKNWPG